MTFYDWCVERYLEKEIVSAGDKAYSEGTAFNDFAYDMKRDVDFPRGITNRAVLSNYLRRQAACDSAILTFWVLFTIYKKEVCDARTID
ncbi:MAG: YozE family protein [Desulfosporosinus sp.]|nr:YozE family protein [Desulfosporosinus sp.]